MKTPAISKKWSALFLDRDGVINLRKSGGYILKPKELLFTEDFEAAIAEINQLFHRVFVVTNQQGVGRGLMSQKDLEKIHNKLLTRVGRAGGSIDKIYCCTSLASENDPRRKPSPGMLLQAKDEFVDIDFKKSWLVGDTISDLIPARELGIKSAFIWSEMEANSGWENYEASVVIPNLMAFVKWLGKQDCPDATVYDGVVS